MVPILALLVPILLAAVFVFVTSFIIHMLLPYHRTDYARLPDEDQVAVALRPLAIPPGEYMIPFGGSPSAMKDPGWIERVQAGPVALVTVFPNGIPKMGKQLAQWFLYCVVVGILTAYVTGRAVDPGDPMVEVFRFAGAVSFIAYTVANWQNTIWYRRSWVTNLKNTIDGLVYGIVTAAAFTWFWPS
jgi:hypothetical protein